MNALTQIRKQLRLSQTEMAEGLGIGQSAVSQFERGLCEPTPGVARKLIDFAKSHGLTITFGMIYGNEEIPTEHAADSA